MDFRAVARTLAAIEPEEALAPPPSCSYCGSDQLEGPEDHGRGERYTCSACGGTMTSNSGYWQPELIGSPANHPSPKADPDSGGVGGAGNVPQRSEDLQRHGAVDWCRHRHAEHCWLPRMDGTAGSVALYPPQDRGICPWKTATMQQINCPVSEPGPMAGMTMAGAQHTAGFGTGTHLSWDEIGERHPHIYGDPDVHGEEAEEGDGPGIGGAIRGLAFGRKADPEAEFADEHDLNFHETHVDPKHVDYARHGGLSDHRVRHAYEGFKAGHDVPPAVLVHRHGVYQVADGHHRAEAAHLAGVKLPAYVAHSPHPDEPFSDYEDGETKAPFHGADPVDAPDPHGKTAALADPELRLHFCATWADVRDKAKRIRSEGGVNILVASGDGVGGNVQGEHGIYETVLSYVPGSAKVAYWQCGCAWAAYTWGRAPAYRRFEGRMCSHALAMQFEAQSRGMFGKEVTPDAERPGWLRRDAPIRVQHERDTKKNLTRRSVPPGNMRTVFGSVTGPDLPPIYAFAADAMSQGSEPGEAMALMVDAGLPHVAARGLLDHLLADPEAQPLPAVLRAFSAQEEPEGPYFHGTRHVLKPGQILTGGHATSNQGMGTPGAHVYYSKNRTFASVFAEGGMGPEDDHDARPRVYQVHPVHGHEPDHDEPTAEAYRATHVKVIREVPYDHKGVDRIYNEGAKKDDPEDDAPTHAGLVLKADDTGRVLMLQRSLEDEEDPAAGTWEWPGGGIEPGDTSSFHGAAREFAEEVGQKVPHGGTLQHVWRSGPYVGHVLVIPNEKQIELHNGRVMPNPDDPKGDHPEQAAWWEPDHAKDNPALRPECGTSPWDEIKKATRGKTAHQEDLATSPTITRGLVAGGRDGRWHPEVAARIARGQASAHDILGNIDRNDVGDFWHGHHDSLGDAKIYAENEDHVGHEVGGDVYDNDHGEPGHIGSVGVVLEAHRPHGWDPSTHHDDGLMGNSYLPHATTLKLHKIHYDDHHGNWHQVDATDHEVHAGGHFRHEAIVSGEVGSQSCPRCHGQVTTGAAACPHCGKYMESDTDVLDLSVTADYAAGDYLEDVGVDPSPFRNKPTPPDGDQPQNPASTGFATSADPPAFQDADARTMSMPVFTMGTLHDEPEPALPSTTGDDDDDDWTTDVDPAHQHIPLNDQLGNPNPRDGMRPQIDPLESMTPSGQTHASLGGVSDVVAQFQATAAAKALQGTEGPSDMDITAAARQFLGTGKTASPDEFSFAEQQELISEGAQGTRARNFGDLKIEGTHYEALQDALAAEGQLADPDELFL